MSAGPFDRSKYEADAGNGGTIHAIRIQPETALLTIGGLSNDPPAGAQNSPFAARARKGNQEYGMGARSVTIAWTGDPPTGYSDETLTIPVLTPAAFAAYIPGATGTYLSTNCEVVSRKPENVR